MKKFFTLMLALGLSYQAIAVKKSWVGTTNLDWNTATNWSPEGVPGPDDDVSIITVRNAPRIIIGTTATINDFTMESGSLLTIEAGATLNISRNTPNSNGFSALVSATLVNYGTLVMNKPLLPSEGRKNGFFLIGSTKVDNHGSMSITVSGDAIVYYLLNSAVVTNHGTGFMTTQAVNDVLFYDPGQFINRGFFNSTGTYGAYITRGSLSNYGFMIMAGTLFNAGNISNALCGYLVAGSLYSQSGSLANAGLVLVNGQLSSNAANFTNDGILKYSSISGAFSNNHIAVTDNADPIFTLGSDITETIDGIYLNQEGTESAGTYTQAANKFTPDPKLPPGPTTLFVKVTPAEGGCSFTVPFVYTITGMPVTLVSFSGKKTDDRITLQWLTTDEKNFDHFEVQRSANARSFETIGIVTSSAACTALNSYYFIDDQAGDESYYRLKMVDADRTFRYSKIISIKDPAQDAAAQAVVGPFYPNPSEGKAEIDLHTIEKGMWAITVMDENGKVAWTENRILQKGMNKVGIDHLTSGLNLVRFQNGKNTVLRKLVKR